MPRTDRCYLYYNPLKQKTFKTFNTHETTQPRTSIHYCNTATSCCGHCSLSEKEVLEFINQENQTNDSRHTTIINKVTDKSKVVNNIGEYEFYEKAGLLTIKDTTITTRSWGRTHTSEAYDIQFTAAGSPSISETMDSYNKVLLFEYTYDKIVDMRLIGSKAIEEFNLESVCYMVYYTGTLTQATPFAEALGCKVGDEYPTLDAPEDQVMSSIIIGYFRDGDLVKMTISKINLLEKSEMDDYFDKQWYKLAKQSVKELD